MPSLGRGRPSATPNRPSRGPATLPPYETPLHALNQNAQHALQDLRRNHKLEALKGKVKGANGHLTQAAADINDRLLYNVQYHEKGKKRREIVNSPSSSHVDDEFLERMKQDTNELTAALDQKARDVIDAGVEIQGVEKALRELDANVTANRGLLAPTQSTLGASQFRTPKRRRLEDADQVDEDDVEDSQAPQGGSAVELFKTKLAEHQDEYHVESLSARYAQHNDYIGFKKMVHDARHPGENPPPVPHHSTWFPNVGGSFESAATLEGAQESDEEDFHVASERISIKCPLTLRPMKDPVSSKNCVHSFERAAILEMIGVSDLRAGGQKAMKCPVCEVVGVLLHLRLYISKLTLHCFRCSQLKILNPTLSSFARSRGSRLPRTHKMMILMKKRIKVDGRAMAPNLKT